MGEGDAMKRKTGVGVAYLMLALLATMPVLAYDFHSWRADVSYVKQTSVGHQTSNAAFNGYEQDLDAGSGTMALYWSGEKQENGGLVPTTTDADDGAFGRTGPNAPLTLPIYDNRQQDREVDWTTWPVVTGKLLAGMTPQPPRPVFTPNVPQGWSPVVYDLDNGFGTADHFLVTPSFEPDQLAPAVTTKEQVLNVYYPQTADGLPGNATAVATADRATSRPFWIRGNNKTTPGLRIRDLEPVRDSLNTNNPGVGVITQPPIFARVQAVYHPNGNPTAVVNETLPVVFLVVGTGENGDFAKVICLALKKPSGMAAGIKDWSPDPQATGGNLLPPLDISAANIGTNIADYFNPNTSTGGAVMWSYTVKLRTDLMMGSNQPTPVAGISFANLGTANNPQPRLYVTTADGQIICLNAQAADQATFSEDGDARLSTPAQTRADDPEPEWLYQTPIVQPVAPAGAPVVTGLPASPVFQYGMAPAVCRVPLTNLFSGANGSPAANTVTNALTKFNVSEWQVFTADAYGVFRSFEAPGEPVFNMAQLTSRNPLPRWVNTPFTPSTATPPPTFRLDAQGNPERFISPPVVYQGGTPLKNDSGAVVNGSSDVGFDDEVVYASARGVVYVLDAIGEFTVGGAQDGRPSGVVRQRFQFPNDDTAPAPPQAGNASVEPRAWPRDVPDATVNVAMAPAAVNDPTLIHNQMGPDLAYGASLFSRSAAAVGLGANVNPNGLNVNLEPGDDNLYIPYLYEVTTTLPNGQNYNPPAGFRAFYEYIGSLKPYGFIQTSRPIQKLTRARVTLAGVTYDIPLNRLKVGIVKANGISSNQVQTVIGSSSQNGANPNYDPAAPAVEDTVYFASTSWFDDTTGQYVQIPVNTPVELQYDAPTSPSNDAPVSVTETLTYPSCYRKVFTDPNDATVTTIARGRASLTEGNARLEQSRYFTPPGMGNPQVVQTEFPALVDSSFFGAYDGRQPSMFVSGSVGAQGNVLAPAWFRGRIIALTQTLKTQRVILGGYDPRLDPNIQMQYSVGPPEANYGPKFEAGARDFTYDPGVFHATGMGMGVGSVFRDDEPLVSDVGSSVSIIDGWVYVTHRNGHVRAYANQGGGGAGVSYGNPPQVVLDQVQPNTSGNLVHAPAPDPLNPSPDKPRGIHFTTNPNDPTDTTAFLDQAAGATVDSPLLIEWGDTINVVVDFGSANELAPPNTVNGNAQWTGNQNDDIDGQVLQNTVQAQIRSPNGAVQQLGAQGRGVYPQVYNGAGGSRVAAVIQVFTGVPSITNPLTPGTPLLWEKDATANPSAWTGEVTYELQVAQQGLRWRWPPYQGANQADPAREHYWETERSQGQTRYPTTSGLNAGVPRWNWNSEWAPLLSYNNPIMLGYDPLTANTNVEGVVGPGIVNSGPYASTVAAVDRYTDRNAPGRKNGDMYAAATVDGSRSGSGQPVVPTVGMGLVNQGGTPVAQQLLFADHGKTTPVTTTTYPDLAKLRVGDRSKLGVAGRALLLRVQAAPLTKMGVGALYGRNGNNALANLPAAPQGSFEQNINAWDDSATGLYSSIPSSRVAVTKQGTNLDLTQTPLQVAGRVAGAASGGLPTFNKVDARNAMEQLAVQVDVPLYTADDVYSTRWRSAEPRGANPAPIGTTFNGTAGSQFNPFYPGTILGQNGRPLRDRAERLSRPAGQGPTPATGEDPGAAPGGFDPNPNMDDRLRRVVVFNDANGNGLLDLTPTFREAYRTFAVQVAVKPDMRIEAQQQTIDLGNLWHGKKQPGMGNGALEIREWQRLQQLASSGNQIDRSAAQFYSQYWRAFNLINTGNVNLAYVKPEVAFQIAGVAGAQLIALPSEANDPWKALRLINGTAGTPNPLVDPFQIFLRTSFDDQLLPDQNAAYGASNRGVWLQKAQPGAAQGGTVAYADPNPNAVAVTDAQRRDPTNGGLARETYISLNIPTGTPLGQYGGSLRFFNDRTVAWVEDLAAPAGFRYIVPPNTAQLSGTLERDPTPSSQGEPLEPVTDPPIRLKTKVVENTIHGRHQTVNDPQDADRRFMPAASPDASAVSNGTVQRLLVAYVSNRRGVAMANAQQTVYDLFATSLNLDPNTGLFPYDELPRERIPWRDLANTVFGWTTVTNSAANTQQLKPSLMQDPSGQAVLAWTERQSVGQGSDQYRVYYQPFTSPAPILMQPGGTPPDPRVPRQGVRMLATSAGGTPYWLTVYSQGQGLNRNISYTFTTGANLANGSSWASERPLPTPKGLASVTDPHLVTTPAMQRVTAIPNQPGQPPFIQNENSVLPEMAWMSFTGSHLQFARTDIYLSRYRVPSLIQAGSRANADLVDRQQDFARVGFPRTEGDVLRGNPERTRFVSSGADFLVQPYSRVKLFIGRPDLPPATTGSTANPYDLIGNQVGTETTNGEIVFPIDPAVVSAAPGGNQARLQQVRIYVDKGAGVFRLSLDARTVMGLLTTPLGSTAPDPVLTADFTAATIRITKGDVPANDSVIIPALSDPAPAGVKVMDASWYRQQLDTGKWASGTPVAGIADRLWVVWRRSAAANSGGATCFYKVLRPGIRVRAGAIYGIRSTELQVGLGGNPVLPEEVNAQTGQIFFPQTYEGQRVDVSYLGPTGAIITESHYVNWQDETGERPVPMDTSVNEGSLDGFASYEDVGMTPFGSNPSPPPAVRHLEKIWLFWSSTRNSGGDLMYATMAPRIGPEANVGNTATFYANSAARFTGQSANAMRAAMAAAAAEERRKPFVIPTMYRRGPYVLRSGLGARRSTR